MLRNFIFGSMASALLLSSAQAQMPNRPPLSDSSIQQIAELTTKTHGNAVGYLRIDDDTNSTMMTMRLVARNIYGDSSDKNIFFIHAYKMDSPLAYYEVFGLPPGFVGGIVASDVEEFMMRNKDTGGLVVITESEKAVPQFIDRMHEFILKPYHQRDAFTRAVGAEAGVKVAVNLEAFTFIFASSKPIAIKPLGDVHPKGLMSSGLHPVATHIVGNNQNPFFVMNRNDLRLQLQGCAGILNPSAKPEKP
jgi:hypothetical protein